MNILGLDIATKTGASIMDSERLIHAEAFRPKGDTDAEIFHGFRVWLRPLIVSHDIEHVGAEQPLPTNLEVAHERSDLGGHHVTKRNPVTMATYMRIYGLFGHAAEIAYALNIPFTPIHQATWRKAFLGSGRATKDQAVAQCKLMGWDVRGKDAAEACGVAWALRGMLNPRLAVHRDDLFAKAS